MKNQRENILEVARQLFYEQGYKNTYLDQIAEICNITKPLISYHFKSKSNLAKEISDAILFDFKNIIALKLYTSLSKKERSDLQTSTAVEIHLYNQLFLVDPKAMRFLKELADDKYQDIYSAKGIHLYQMHDRRYHLDINRESDELSMIATASRSACFSILLAYERGEYQCTTGQCLDYMTRLNFVLMHLEKNRIDEILENSKRILTKVHFEYKPYFIIE